MTIQELYTAIAPVAEHILQIPRFNDDVNMTSTPSWDSLKHVQLLSAIERKFGIEISADEAFKLTSAGKLVRHLHSVLEPGTRA